MNERNKNSLANTINEGMRDAAHTAGTIVKAGMKTGKAISGIAAGTATGGPAGAAIAALWSARHTLFKIIVSLCLLLLFILVTLLSLPKIVWNYATGRENGEAVSLSSAYIDLERSISVAMEEAHQSTLEHVHLMIKEGGYDEELSMQALIDLGETQDYDVCEILAIYSISIRRREGSCEDMTAKLTAASGFLYPISYTEKDAERTVPKTYPIYRPISLTVVTGKTDTEYLTEQKIFYEPAGTAVAEQPMDIPVFRQVSVTLPLQENGEVIGTETVWYFEPDGMQRIEPKQETVKIIVCTIHEPSIDSFFKAFGVDPKDNYEDFNITCAEAVQYMSTALKQTIGDE